MQALLEMDTVVPAPCCDGDGGTGFKRGRESEEEIVIPPLSAVTSSYRRRYTNDPALEDEVARLRRIVASYKRKAELASFQVPGPADLYRWAEKCDLYATSVNGAIKAVRSRAYRRAMFEKAVRGAVIQLAMRGGQPGVFYLSITLRATKRTFEYQPTEDDLEDNPYARPETIELEPYAVRMVYSGCGDNQSEMRVQEEGLIATRSMYLYMDGPMDQLSRLQAACKEEFRFPAEAMFLLATHGLELIPRESRQLYLDSLHEHCFLRQVLSMKETCDCFSVEAKQA